MHRLFILGTFALGMAVALPAISAQTAGAPGPVSRDLLWEPITNQGVLRASGRVDSVFVDRASTLTVVAGGDWVSYLAARLGVVPIPEPSGIRVAVDSAVILVSGQLRDLPAETRAAFGPLAMFLDSTTALRAEVVMAPSQPGHVRFVLRSILVNGFAIPEAFLAPVLAQVGKQYPVLTPSGRQLLIATPEDGTVRLVRNGVVLETGRR